MDIIFAPFEIVLNKILFQDPKFSNFLEKYNNKILLINSVYIKVSKSGFGFSLKTPDSAPDLVIKFPYSKSIILFIETMQDKIDHTQLDLDGDLGLAQDFFGVFKNYDSFYLNKIAKIFGDIFSYGSDCVDSTIRKNINTKHKNLKDMFICYLEDELQVTATTEEIRDFNDQVDKIRLDCDRLEARINQLISG